MDRPTFLCLTRPYGRPVMIRIDLVVKVEDMPELASKEYAGAKGMVTFGTSYLHCEYVTETVEQICAAMRCNTVAV